MKSIALGSIYAIMVSGSIIVFKGTQVLNFAHGAIAMSGAIFMSILVSDGDYRFCPSTIRLLRRPARRQGWSDGW
ncbi:MAG: hypothetical protein R2706_02535 [Acidimicrobiales bacterium]